MQALHWKIDGMHCGGCARTLQALLARVAGVHRVEVSWPQAQARLLVDDGDAVPARLAELIERAGYRIGAADT
jgi:copper chaperone CopZ